MSVVKETRQPGHYNVPMLLYDLVSFCEKPFKITVAVVVVSPTSLILDQKTHE